MNQTETNTMKAAAVDQFGGLENLKIKTLPVPQPDPHEILIEVETAGVGVWDPYEREGEFAEMLGLTPTFPYVLGSDGAGTVIAVGKNVTRFKKGDHVYAINLASPKGGFYAQFAAAKESNAAKIPKNITTEQAGVLPVDGVTALRGLDDTLQLKARETVMIFGASGGIGHLAVQLAKRMGARVFAVASGADGQDLVKQLGADEVVDGHQEGVATAARKFSPGGVDAALMTAGGDAANKALEGVKDGGRVAYPNGVEPLPIVRPGVRLQAYDGDVDAYVLEKLNRLVEQGPFFIHIARAFPLEQAVEAQRALNQHFLGKLALRMN